MADIPNKNSDLMRMQQEAIRRVRMMQERAQKTIESPGGTQQREQATGQPSKPEPQPRRYNMQKNAPSRQRRGSPAALFGAAGEKDFISKLLTGDSERTLLLVLLLILIEEHSDTYLILALLYLIL